MHCADGEAKFWLEPGIELAQTLGLNARQLRAVRSLIKVHEDDIRAAWTKHLAAEVTNVSAHGFWVLLADEELFVPFTEFPWFQDASIRAITHMQWLSPNHLYWPDLDVDLAVDSIRHPDRFPLVARVDA